MAASWRVIAQRPFEELTPQGTFESVIEVTFQLGSGTIGNLKVPARLYSEEYVRDLIQERADVMIAVENL